MATETRVGLWQRLRGAPPKAHEYTTPAPDAQVTPDPARCVQCGVCGYNCPVGIPVRDYAGLGRSVDDVRCVQCGQCIEVCPRGTLRWVRPRSALHGPDADDYAALVREFFGEQA
jgi:ferredoxin